jgi:hypothetical protein
MRHIKTIKRAYLTDVNLDDVISRHIELVTNPKVHYEWVDDGKPDDRWGISMGDFETVIDKEGKRPPRKAILIHKYKFLIHDIIMRCRASKDNSVQLNYARYVSILGKAYGDMLYTLNDLELIHLSNTYTMGKTSRRISLNDWNIDFVDDSNIKVIEYVDRLRLTYLESVKKYTSEGDNSAFIKKYNECLSKLELVNRTEALEYIENRKTTFNNLHSYNYYKSRIEDFNKGDLLVSSIDSNGRIYHYLTNLPKSLKRFFNIRWQLDIANSHPLLFSYFLIKEYNISIDIISFLKIIQYNDIIEYHNKGKQLRKLLKNNNIKVQGAKILPNDVLLYVFVTMKGRFWDDFVEVFHTLDRGEVKSSLFREVFYSYSTTTRNREYAKQFAQIYPNVWHSIRLMKKTSKGNLPNKMMSFESKLFGAILRRCYEKNWYVVSIHDAIVVLDVVENEHLDIGELKGIMSEEYARCGLFPTISTEMR